MPIGYIHFVVGIFFGNISVRLFKQADINQQASLNFGATLYFS